MLLDKWCPRADLNHRHEDFQKRWHNLTQQYQRAKSQNQWCAIYCAIGCLFRHTQKHCVQHRKAAIDWLECFWPPFLFLLANRQIDIPKFCTLSKYLLF